MPKDVTETNSPTIRKTIRMSPAQAQWIAHWSGKLGISENKYMLDRIDGFRPEPKAKGLSDEVVHGIVNVVGEIEEQVRKREASGAEVPMAELLLLQRLCERLDDLLLRIPRS